MKFVTVISLASAVAVVASVCSGRDKIDAERTAPAIEAKRTAPTAVICAEKCRFTFPIENIHKAWDWGASNPDTCEYSWMVTIKTGDNDYQLGFSYFNAGAGVWSGTFTKLLRVGQTDLWLLEEDGLGASRVEGVRVDASVEGNCLVFEISDKKWSERLFKTKPKDVTFKTGGSQLPTTSEACRVDYATAEKRNDR